MLSYRCVFTREAHDFICRASDDEMRELDGWLDRIERNPGLPGDYIEAGHAGRELQVACIQHLAVSYWVDHAVQEVRIIRIEPST
jgi:hypothetical protein